MDDRRQFVIDRFRQIFGGTPRIAQAPGRVNLIGEHTDYNDGIVMPVAIDLYTWAAAVPRKDRKLVIHSENFQEEVTIDLLKLPPQASGHWSDYIVGVVMMLSQSDQLPGANVLLSGNVPQGAGLSSSASLEVAVAYLLLELAGETPDPQALALLCQKAENEFVGARCGIMDQFVAAHGKRQHALMLDCRSLAYRLIPLTERVRLVICNSMVRHTIAKGEYNNRRAECEAAARYFQKLRPDVKALRDIGNEDITQHHKDLPDTIMRRCRHVVTENARVLEAADALQAGDFRKFGTFMKQSHQSLRDDFEVSCSELDLLVDLAQRAKGVYGARMTGGGFGGCTINLVEQDCVQEFQMLVSEGYSRATGIAPEIYICKAADHVQSE